MKIYDPLKEKAASLEATPQETENADTETIPPGADGKQAYAPKYKDDSSTSEYLAGNGEGEDREEPAPAKSPGEQSGDGLPILKLPGGVVTITHCANQLFRLIAPTKRLFARGGAVVSLVKRDDGLLGLEILRPSAARSFFEKFASLVVWRKAEKHEWVLKPTCCPHDMADALLQSQEAALLLPYVEGLINCPILREVDGRLSVAGLGYDEQTRLLITGGSTPPIVELAEAVHALRGLLAEFDFQSEGDGSRAVASLMTPALKSGKFLRGRVPADVAEADASQAGKGYRQRVAAAIYNEQLTLVTNREGGVGSVDETLDQALVAGRPFIQFDNFRGRFESAHLEAFMTAEGTFPCRVPHRGSVTVTPENYFVFLTSNGVDTTRDFANRSNIIRNKKKPLGFVFANYPEGELLSHVRAHQAYYLGCVFAVIREWHRRGKPHTGETRHSFLEWCQTVDWIAQNIFGTVPIMEGHQEAQERVSNPALVWLRSVVLAISETGELGQAMTATELFGLCGNADIEVPGLRSGADEAKGKKAIGTIMGKLFREQNMIEVEGFNVTREEKYLARDNPSDGGNFKSKLYTVTRK